MKKSKLIVPAALAVMLLSTAASVTGTVAWFTANRAVSIDANNFEVVSTDGTLDYAITEGNCTTVTKNANNKDVVSISTGKKLTDASVDLISSVGSMTVYTDEANDEGTEPNAFSPVAANTDYVVPGTNDAVYYCATWTIRFIYTFGGGATDTVDLLFNCGSSVFTSGTTTKNAANSSTLDTSLGFRIGMFTSGQSLVFADLQTLANCNYIKNTAASGDPVYGPAASGAAGSWAAYTAVSTSAGNLVDSANSLGLANDDESHTSRGDYLGTITKGSGTGATSDTGTIDVNFVAWFEGTDPNVKNDAVFKLMSATLKFYTRRGA